VTTRLAGTSVTGTTFVKDEETSFLAPTGNWKVNGFTPTRKIEFLKHLMKNPSPGYASKETGISYHCFMNHYKIDAEFKSQVDSTLRESIALNKGDIENTMLCRAKEPNGFMDRMAWLRRHAPGEYNETRKVEHSISPSTIEQMNSSTNKFKVIDVDPIAPTTGEDSP